MLTRAVPQTCSTLAYVRHTVLVAAALSFLLVLVLSTVLSQTIISVAKIDIALNSRLYTWQGANMSRQGANYFETDNASSSGAETGNGELLSTLSGASYLGFLEIDEQLSSNSEKFIQLYYLSALWNFNIVEPWIKNDTLYLTSIPTKNSKSNLLFTDLYNQTKMEERLSHHCAS